MAAQSRGGDMKSSPPKRRPGVMAGSPVKQAKQVAQRNPILWSAGTQPCLSHFTFRQLDFAKNELEKAIREIFGGTPEKVERALRNAKSSISDALRLIEYDIADRGA